MFDQYKSQLPDIDPGETEEWLESLESLIDVDGPQRAAYNLGNYVRHSVRETEVPPDNKPQRNRWVEMRAGNPAKDSNQHIQDSPRGKGIT